MTPQDLNQLAIEAGLTRPCGHVKSGKDDALSPTPEGDA